MSDREINEYRKIDNEFRDKVYEILDKELPLSVSSWNKMLITELITTEHLIADSKMLNIINTRMFSRKESEG